MQLFSSFQCKIRIGDPNHKSRSDDGTFLVFNILVERFHPDYLIENAYFDVSVLETSPVTFSRYIYPICISTSDSFDINEYNQTPVQLIGWGSGNKFGQNSKVLKRVQLTAFPLR